MFVSQIVTRNVSRPSREEHQVGVYEPNPMFTNEELLVTEDEDGEKLGSEEADDELEDDDD